MPTVAEGAEYTELQLGDNVETSSFVKKGGYIGLTLEAIDRDDGRKLRQIPRELAFAALREISALVAAIFTDNSAVGPTLADTGALFNNTAVTTAGGHANLLTTALGTDFTAWDAVAAAMYNQPMLVQERHRLLRHRQEDGHRAQVLPRAPSPQGTPEAPTILSLIQSQDPLLKMP